MLAGEQPPAHLERARAAARRAARGDRRDREPRARRVRRRRAERRRRAHRHRPHAPAGRAHRERRALLAAGHHRHGALPARPGPARRQAHHASKTGASACPPSKIEEANALLASPPDIDVGMSQRLGFHVVARLATRHGIKVGLSVTPGSGTTALVSLPPSLFAPLYPAAAASVFAARPAADRRPPRRAVAHHPRRPRPRWRRRRRHRRAPWTPPTGRAGGIRRSPRRCPRSTRPRLP